jgi:hypothetical protein
MVEEILVSIFDVEKEGFNVFKTTFDSRFFSYSALLEYKALVVLVGIAALFFFWCFVFAIPSFLREVDLESEDGQLLEFELVSLVKIPSILPLLRNFFDITLLCLL